MRAASVAVMLALSSNVVPPLLAMFLAFVEGVRSVVSGAVRPGSPPYDEQRSFSAALLEEIWNPTYVEYARLSVAFVTLYLVTAACASWWLVGAYRRADTLGARYPRLTGWLVVEYVFLPYRVLGALDRTIDPTTLPEPPEPSPEEGPMGYREPAPVRRPPGRTREWKAPPLGLSWVLLLVMGSLEYFRHSFGSQASFSLTLSEYAATSAFIWAAILVVHRIDAKLDERARRLGGQRAA